MDETTEGASFWLRVMNEQRNRNVKDVLTAVVDGLKGFAEAINAVIPRALVHVCIVHLIRNSLDLSSGLTRPRRGNGASAPWKGHNPVVLALREI